MNHLAELRDEEYARQNWPGLRPFFCWLAPELVWREMRSQVVEELREEVHAQIARDFEYATYFTYPTDEQMEMLHEEADGGIFFSEIREGVGFRSTQALATLAGMIRLESEGDTRLLLEESFWNLWSKFSQSLYGHGYDTPSTRETLVRALASNNALDLVKDRQWINGMLDYFTTDTHPWSGEPLRDSYSAVIRILGGEPKPNNSDDPAFTGGLDLSGESLEDLQEELRWEQGIPEDFGRAEPPSRFYLYPYHLMRVHGVALDCVGVGTFEKLAAHFLLTLQLRTVIVDAMDIGKPFSVEQAADAIEASEDDARFVLGQMIKLGLVEFDRTSPWHASSQQYACQDGARAIASDSGKG